MRSWTSLIALVVVLGACGPRQKLKEGSLSDRESRCPTVMVDNRSWEDVTVYVNERRALSVGSLQRASRRVCSLGNQSLERVDLEPLAGGADYAVGVLHLPAIGQLDGHDVLALVIQPNLDHSYLNMRRF